jgi:hypothetical protein
VAGECPLRHVPNKLDIAGKNSPQTGSAIALTLGSPLDFRRIDNLHSPTQEMHVNV